MSSPRALILGVGGQDGSYLADILVENGYEVHGIYRHSSLYNLSRIDHLAPNIHLHAADLTDPLSIVRVLELCPWDEIYNEADQDSVGWSRKTPAQTMDITATAVANLFEAIYRARPTAKVFQPCSAHMYGDPAYLPANTPSPQNERTPFNPQSPYGIAKVAAYHWADYYRRSKGLHIVTGILYNHDSPRRTEEYLLHKICNAAVRIQAGTQQTVALGNLDSRVDVGSARDYMVVAHKLMQLSTPPDDYVIGTGTNWCIADLASRALWHAGVLREPLEYVTRDDEFFYPTPKAFLVADTTKLIQAIGHKPDGPEKVIRELIDSAIVKQRKGVL